MAYSVRQDIYDLAFKAETYRARPIAVESVDPIADVLTIPSHGIDPNDVIRFTLTGGASAVPGHAQPILPFGLNASVLYFPLLVGSDMIQVSTTPGGTPVDITSTGSAPFGVVVDPGRKLDRINESAAAIIDGRLTAHDAPIQRDASTGKYPEILVTLNARLAGRMSVNPFGLMTGDYIEAIKALDANLEKDWGIFEEWVEGRPIAGVVDQNTEPDNGAVSGYDMAPTMWRSGTL